mmetsp:Transcript_401/g.1771  ORF Transcript_401/g.1771 Transcript_401/m.1771 type:complete len:270 (+) Transcript_401:3951-4760(+)
MATPCELPTVWLAATAAVDTIAAVTNAAGLAVPLPPFEPAPACSRLSWESPAPATVAAVAVPLAGQAFPPNQQGGSSHNVFGFWELQHLYPRIRCSLLMSKHHKPGRSQKADGHSVIASSNVNGMGWLLRCRVAAELKSTAFVEAALAPMAWLGALYLPMLTDMPDAPADIWLAPGMSPPMALSASPAREFWGLKRFASADIVTKPSSSFMTRSAVFMSSPAPFVTMDASRAARCEAALTSGDRGVFRSPSKIEFCTEVLLPATDITAS